MTQTQEEKKNRRKIGKKEIMGKLNDLGSHSTKRRGKWRERKRVKYNEKKKQRIVHEAKIVFSFGLDADFRLNANI